MKKLKPVACDFETFEIEGRPSYPPVPVGLAIKYPGKKAKYLAWGHSIGNNSTWAEARDELEKAYTHPDGVVFHNSKFDLDVAEVHMGLPIPHWSKCHDTMFLLFLDDPDRAELALKPSSEKLLNWPPEERDAVAEWLAREQPVRGVKITASQGKNGFGRFIPYAPGATVVGPYACGDVERTEALFELLYPLIVERDMLPAYDRERRLLPALLESERSGMRVDLPRLRADVAKYRRVLVQCEEYVKKRLKVGDDFNIGSGQQLMGRLEELELIDPTKVERTPTGLMKSDEIAFKQITDKPLGAVLTYRVKLSTTLVTFMENWLRVAERSGGFIYTSWNQTRGDSGGGTRTGRLSSNPNFQNITKEFPPFFYEQESEEAFGRRKAEQAKVGKKAARLPKCPVAGGLPSLPLARSYIIPYTDDEVLLDRDYSQQELRILAHFEGGAMLDQYLADPWLDFHDSARIGIEEKLHKYYERTPIKTINFGIIYGQGTGSLAVKNESTVEETKELKEAILSLYPGIKDFMKELKALAKADNPLVTWGGRQCFCEPPKFIKGRLVNFEYKMLNTAIQSSAADCTKEAIIRWYEGKHLGERLYAQVHDQITISARRGVAREAMAYLKSSMESVEFDIPIFSEGKYGNDWAALKTYDKKGVMAESLARSNEI
jgi:DNA polymerase-1